MLPARDGLGYGVHPRGVATNAVCSAGRVIRVLVIAVAGADSFAAALWVGAVSYLFSAAMFKVMRPFGIQPNRAHPVKARLKTGVRLNWTDLVLCRSTAGALLANIGGPIFVTQMPVLAYQGLHLSAGVFGTVMSIAAIGAVLGAVVAPAISRRLG